MQTINWFLHDPITPNRNGTSHRLVFSYAESELFLRCCEQFLNMADSKAVSRVMAISEGAAKSLDLPKHFHEIVNCFLTNIRTLPGDVSITLRAIEIVRQKVNLRTGTH